jgi:hypothetical protein
MGVEESKLPDEPPVVGQSTDVVKITDVAKTNDVANVQNPPVIGTTSSLN